MILLIDRDPDTRSILRSALEWNGYEVLEASDAVAGLRMARTVAAGLIIMEHPLDVEGGSTLLHAVRDGTRTATLPILVTTATGGAESIAQALELGCDAVLIKPFLPSRVLEEARRLLGTSGSREGGA